MKITHEILSEMGAVAHSPFPNVIDYVVKVGGVATIFRQRPGEGWDVNGHVLTDVEEIFSTQYLDGYRDGHQDARTQLKDWFDGTNMPTIP